MRAEQARQLQSVIARQVLEAIEAVERRQQVLMDRQESLLRLCHQLLLEQHAPGPGDAGGSSGGGTLGSSGNSNGGSSLASSPGSSSSGGISSGTPAGARCVTGVHPAAQQQGQQQDPSPEVGSYPLAEAAQQPRQQPPGLKQPGTPAAS